MMTWALNYFFPLFFLMVKITISLRTFFVANYRNPTWASFGRKSSIKIKGRVKDIFTRQGTEQFRESQKRTGTDVWTLPRFLFFPSLIFFFSLSAEHLLPLTALRLYLSSFSIRKERSLCLSSKWKNPKKEHWLVMLGQKPNSHQITATRKWRLRCKIAALRSWL